MNNYLTTTDLAGIARSKGYDLTAPVILFHTTTKGATTIPASAAAVEEAAREGIPITMTSYASIDDLLARRSKLTGSIIYDYLLAGIEEFNAKTPIEVFADGNLRFPS